MIVNACSECPRQHERHLLRCLLKHTEPWSVALKAFASVCAHFARVYSHVGQNTRRKNLRQPKLHGDASPVSWQCRPKTDSNIGLLCGLAPRPDIRKVLAYRRCATGLVSAWKRASTAQVGLSARYRPDFADASSLYWPDVACVLASYRQYRQYWLAR